MKSWARASHKSSQLMKRGRKCGDMHILPLFIHCDDLWEALAHDFMKRQGEGRVGFNNTVENSVHVKRGAHRKGVGSKLLSDQIAKCASLGLRQIVAVKSSDADTTDASVAVHKRFGFQLSGALPAIGYKCNKWIDCMFYQLSVGDGANSSPTFVIRNGEAKQI